MFGEGGTPLLLFASRPLGTYFTENPLGWYLYRWEVATTPAYVEWREVDNFIFIGTHLVAALAAVSLVLRAWLRGPR